MATTSQRTHELDSGVVEYVALASETATCIMSLRAGTERSLILGEGTDVSGAVAPCVYLNKDIESYMYTKTHAGVDAALQSDRPTRPCRSEKSQPRTNLCPMRVLACLLF